MLLPTAFAVLCVRLAWQRVRAGGTGVRQATFDRLLEEAQISGSGAPVDGVPLRDIVAVQLCTCSSRIYGNLTVWRTTHELNLVVRGLPGGRINLMAHGRADAIAEDARHLAEFLGVPLLDHT